MFKIGLTAALLWLALAIAGLVGWVINIIALARHLPVTDMETVLRAVGVVLAPLGALFGWFL